MIVMMGTLRPAMTVKLVAMAYREEEMVTV